jgi:O-antigen/teichoic acid export membrane protein
MVSFFVFYRLLGDAFGSLGVGQYALMRRVLAVLIPVALLGLPEAMGRFIARANEGEEKRAVIAAGAVLSLFSTVIIVGALLVDTAFSALWLFGAAEHEALVGPFAVFFCGLAVHSFTYACLRGSLRIRLASILQMGNLGVFPILLILALHDWPLRDLIFILGLGNLFVGAAFLALSAVPTDLRVAWSDHGQKIFRFGISRLFGTVAAVALLSVGPMIAVHYVPMEEVGYLSLSIALLIGIGGIANPLGAVLLPHVSQLIAKGEKSRFDAVLYVLFGAIFQVFGYLTGQFIVFSDYLLRLWMGPGFVSASGVASVTFIALTPYAFFTITKNLLDASTTRPVNSINTAISLAVLLLVTAAIVGIAPPRHITLAFAVVFSFAYLSLALLTYFSVGKVLSLKKREDLRHLIWGTALILVSVAVSSTLKAFVTSSVVLFMAFQGVMFFGYVLVLKRMDFPWVKMLERKPLRS